MCFEADSMYFEVGSMCFEVDSNYFAGDTSCSDLLERSYKYLLLF